MEQLGRTTLPWDGPLRSKSIEELRALAAQAEELAAHPAWTFISEVVAQKVENLMEGILPPQVQEHAAYIAAASQIFGMRVVIDCPEAIRVIAQRREDQEREAAQRAAGQENR